MSPLFILLPLTLVGMIAAGYAFIWAVRSDQFDDMEGPAHQILFDEDIRPLEETEKAVQENIATENIEIEKKVSEDEADENKSLLTAQKRLEDEDRS